MAEATSVGSGPISALLASLDAARTLSESLEKGKRVLAVGACGSSTSFLSAAVARLTSRPVLLVLAHGDDADASADELAAEGVDAVLFPALEALPGETNVSMDLVLARSQACSRAQTLGAARTGDRPTVIVATVQALMQAIPDSGVADRMVRVVRRGDRIGMSGLVDWLVEMGYRRIDAVEEPGDYAVRGGIVDVFLPAGRGAVRVDLFGDEVDGIFGIDTDTMGSTQATDAVELVGADPTLAIESASKGERSLLDVLPEPGSPAGVITLLAETMEITEQARGYFERLTDSRGVLSPPNVLGLIARRSRAVAEVCSFAGASAGGEVRVDLPIEPLPPIPSETDEAMELLSARAQGGRALVPCQSVGELQRMGEHVGEAAAAGKPQPQAGAIEPYLAYVHRGFVVSGSAEPTMIVPYHELMHRFGVRRRHARIRSHRAMDTFLDIAVGDVVVHVDHGIAKFVGLVMLEPRHVKDTRSAGEILEGKRRRRVEPEEYLVLEFAGGATLNVPAMQIDQVQKYVGGFKGKPPLSTLGGEKWKNQKARVYESVRDLAAELLRVRAARAALPGVRFPSDTAWQREFEAEFPHEETEDQVSALVEIKTDMQSERPMDRLLCGDVGFGKTELAIRAAFKAVEFGKQVAVLVPTTVLAEQHERTFRDRFGGYPFRIASVSRFKTGREIGAVLRELREGRIDVVVGTHRLLSKDVRFADLGLVIVDEEQRFGVEHKDRLLQFRLTADVLTLSATPIPRTLHMSLLGLRDISSLTTAPLDRQAVVTEVTGWNPVRIRQAIARELAREGQVFFVHNRVYDIRSAADDVQKLAPGARIVVGHGQMEPAELEGVMLKFIRREADILVSTTIIESGIDIPTANTIIVADADRFGLADLHQLRGRVGRWKHRAYCYLCLPVDRPVRPTAKRRLAAMEQYSMLGAGFKIAMRDLEIRGAGNLLGAEQSGHIAAVGYDMYCRLLEEAVGSLERKGGASRGRTIVEIGITGSIPRAYIASDGRRLDAYRRLAQASTHAEIAKAGTDMASAFGPVPKAAERLMSMAALRVGLAEHGVRSVVVRSPDAVLRTIDVQRTAAALGGCGGRVRTVAADAEGTEADVYLRLESAAMEPTRLMRTLLGAFAPHWQSHASGGQLERAIR